jgi:hypothetical protein
MNSAEKQKRKWLEEIIEKYSDHKFLYFAMLTNTHEGRGSSFPRAVTDSKRKIAYAHFRIDMMEKFHGKDVVSEYNGTDLYTKTDWKKYTKDFITKYKAQDDGKDVIVFTDPDVGFYQKDITLVKEKKHINIEMIEMLMDTITENSLVICYQQQNQATNPSTVKDRQLKQHLNNTSIKMNDEIYNDNKSIKFYIFYKGDGLSNLEKKTTVNVKFD